MARTRRQKSAEHAEGVARKIWLAGLGAYGKSLEDAQGQLDKASQEASRFFQDLVDKGQNIENQTRGAIRSRIDEARSLITERAESNTRSVEELIQRVRDRVAPESGVHGQLGALTRRVDSLASALSKLGGAKPKPRRRASGAGSTAARAKPSAAKPAATSKAAKKPARAAPGKRTGARSKR